jgi:pre-mRNA-splicing factor 38A
LSPLVPLQNLIEKITRNKIYSSVYWKKDCFGLSAEALVDKAVELKYVGGMMGEPQKPSEFICLILKMLQIQPDKEIIIEFIKNDDYKYVRLLGEAQAADAGSDACPAVCVHGAGECWGASMMEWGRGSSGL